MSMKINVIYKGIIYRVKGIKVLCSVVLAVVALLAAIAGVGVWMLVNTYDRVDDINSIIPNTVVKSNITETSVKFQDANQAPFIDFGKSKDVVPSSILLQDVQNEKYIEEKKKVIPQTRFYDTGIKDTEGIQLQTFSEYPEEENTRFTEQVNLNNEDRNNADDEWRVVVKEEKRIPDRRIPQNVNVKTIKNTRLNDRHDLAYTNRKIVERMGLTDHAEDQGAPQSDSENNFRAKLKALSRIPISTNPDIPRIAQASPKHKLTYLGPPVVGYGRNPYEVMTRNRIREYDDFWRNYVKYSKDENKPSTDEVVTKPLNSRPSMQAHLRGLRPIEPKYNVQIRPDAQRPPNINSPKIRTQSKHYSPNIPVSNNNSNPPIPRINNPPLSDPDRRLFIGDETQKNSLPQPLNRPAIKSNPLQNLYDYSKKLAASLLSFNTKSPTQIRESSQKLAEYGINLIESHNNVFSRPTKGPLQRIASLIPSAERLKSLDAFELSLITWTFLDFWEFLIEKVGTLSNEDLSLLQKRLERLRNKKDNAMTRVFVNETLTRYSAGTQRRLSDSKTSHLKNHQIIPDTHKINDQNTEKETLNDSEQLGEDPILANLFPSVVKQEPEKDPKSPQDETETAENSNATIATIHALLRAPIPHQTDPRKEDLMEASPRSLTDSEGRSMWDPLGIFTSEGRMEFMQFAVKVLFNFGKVYLKKPYALDCSMLLFCKDLNQNTRRGGIQAMAAKLKSVGLKVLTESEQQLREADTFREVWRSVTAWTPLQCDTMFPRCDGPKALEIVNEVALGTN